MKKILLTLSAIMLFGCANGDVQMTDAYRSLMDKNIYFGHQSVGKDILNGVDDLRLGIKIHDFYIGHNEDPISKIVDFENEIKQAVESGQRVDIAMMKFCFVDLPGTHTPQILLEDYASMVERLNASFPNLTIVHMTIPLTTYNHSYTSKAKTLAKKGLGRFVNRNEHREQYNSLLKERFADDSIFDVAAIQSKNRTYTEDGSAALLPGYTYDGGHLNEVGRRVVAHELLDFLVQL